MTDNESNEKNVTTENNESGEVLVGVPTMGLVPARNYSFTISEDVYLFEIPCEGKYVDLNSEHFTEEDGSFILYKEGTFVLSSISRVMFAAGNYPKLEANELFCPLHIQVEEEKNNLKVYGQVVSMISGENKEETKEDE